MQIQDSEKKKEHSFSGLNILSLLRKARVLSFILHLFFYFFPHTWSIALSSDWTTRRRISYNLRASLRSACVNRGGGSVTLSFSPSGIFHDDAGEDGIYVSQRKHVHWRLPSSSQVQLYIAAERRSRANMLTSLQYEPVSAQGTSAVSIARKG